MEQHEKVVCESNQGILTDGFDWLFAVGMLVVHLLKRPTIGEVEPLPVMQVQPVQVQGRPLGGAIEQPSYGNHYGVAILCFRIYPSILWGLLTF